MKLLIIKARLGRKGFLSIQEVCEPNQLGTNKTGPHSMKITASDSIVGLPGLEGCVVSKKSPRAVFFPG
jgi:hypothetical protein